jgi:hypothetical protein
MDGLLDFAKSPEGQGLLAAAFGGLAGARRGAPLNALGMAGVAGLNGYGDAQQRQTMEQYKNMQAAQIGMALQKQKAAMGFFNKLNGQDPSADGAPLPTADMGPSAAPQTSPLTFGSMGGAMPASLSGPAPSGMPAQVNTTSASMPQQPQQNGAFPLGLKDIAAYQMLGLDGGGTLLDLYKQANNPQERKGGNYYVDPRTGAQTYMPKLAEGVTMGSNGQAMPVQGAAQANAGYKGAEAGSVAAAQFPYAVAQKAAEQRGAAGYDPMKVVGQDGNEYFVPRLNVATGGDGAAPGQGGGFMAGRNPVTQDATKGLNNDFISNSYRPTLDSGKAAQDMNGNISAMRSIPVETGWATEAKAAAANVLSGLGVAPQNAQLFGSNAQKFQSVAMSQINKQLQDNKGTQTEGDAARALQTFASLEKTPMANAYILDLAQAKNNSAIRKADYYEKAIKIAQERGIPLSEVDAQYRKVQQSIWADPVMSRWLPQGKQ